MNGHCSLYNSPDDRSTSTSCLDSITLTSSQLKRVKNLEELEIDFENHLVTIEIAVTENVAPPLKAPKFVPPRIVAPTVLKPIAAAAAASASASITTSKTALNRRTNNGAYDVPEDELDNLWGESEIKVASHSEEHTASSSRPTEMPLEGMSAGEHHRVQSVLPAEDLSRRGGDVWDDESPLAGSKDECEHPLEDVWGAKCIAPVPTIDAVPGGDDIWGF